MTQGICLMDSRNKYGYPINRGERPGVARMSSLRDFANRFTNYFRFDRLGGDAPFTTMQTALSNLRRGKGVNSKAGGSK